MKPETREKKWIWQRTRKITGQLKLDEDVTVSIGGWLNVQIENALKDAITEGARAAEERATRAEEILDWLCRRGGLGFDAHDRIERNRALRGQPR